MTLKPWIDIMYGKIIWMYFAPDLLPAHVASGEPYYHRSHVLPYCPALSEKTVRLRVSADAEITAELATTVTTP